MNDVKECKTLCNKCKLMYIFKQNSSYYYRYKLSDLYKKSNLRP